MTRPPNRTANILVVDDEQGVRRLLCALLEDSYQCTEAESAEQALIEIGRVYFDLVISDINMPGMSGIDLTSHVVASSPDTVVMMISGAQSPDMPIQALRSGAFDYIRKPFDVDQIEIAVDRALRHASLLASKREHENRLEVMVAERTLKLDYLAYNDSLTGLRNRAFFEESVERELAVKADSDVLAVLLVSLDRFKDLRDTLGHAAGDLLLIEVARRLMTVPSDAAAVARFDGDEFAILLAVADKESVLKFTADVFEAFSTPISAGDDEITSAISVGISLLETAGDDAATLLRNAGASLSYVRSKGGSDYRLFTPDLGDAALARLAIESDLRRGLERDEFELYYQPKVDVASRIMVGAEALLRWNRAGAGMVSPADFIPIAEESGIIVPLGDWVLRAACAQTKLWHDQGFLLHVAVNLSPRQFQQDDLAAKVIGIVDESGMNPNFLNLEVTESSIMQNTGSAVRILRDLRATGIKISIDDFGTGHSSLGVLKDLPIDVLKIDKSFVDDINVDADDAALVIAVITLAHNLRLSVVAEGVESPEQLGLLEQFDCDEWQGYLFSRPLPVHAFEELIARESADDAAREKHRLPV